MKISSILMGFLIIILTAGCSQVVYRVNPDSPPKMGIQEARDAIELTLSLAQKNVKLQSITYKENEFVIMTRERRFNFTAEYSDISKNIMKQGNNFGVLVWPIHLHPDYQSIILYWKSEEDARLFVDAVHALLPAKRRIELDKTGVAKSPPPSSQKDVPQESLKQVEKAPQPKITAPDLAKGKTEPALPPDSSLTSLSPSIPAEKTPPRITVTAPKVTSSHKFATRQSNVIVAGLAESKSGIAEVAVNGLPANLSENGKFSAEVLLKVGKNTIVITALDTQRNRTTSQFIIDREKVSDSASIRPSSTVSEEKIPPRITITAPDAARSLKVVARQKSITVIGVVESKSGITEVMVNGLSAELDEKGNFSADVPLTVGQNTIVVTAIDVLKNQSTKKLVINRDAGKVAAIKKEEVASETELPSASYHALLISVQDYDNGEISKLEHAITDARRLRDILVSNYTFEKENTIILENPDRRTIFKTLQALRKKLTEKDNLLIFYAGHGYWSDDMKQGFWLPRDASGINDPSDWIPNGAIRDYIKAIKAKHLLLIADACFGGGIFKVRDAFPKRQVAIDKIYEMPSRKAITSGSLKTVPDRSVFLDFLIKRLRENNDMYLDSQKLFLSLREAVINNSPTHQTPLYGAISETGDEGGDFIFVRKP